MIHPAEVPAQIRGPLSQLDAAAAALARAARPLSAKELVAEMVAQRLTDIGGLTPWKTVTARISQDIIRYGEKSRFKRTYHGRFALRHWSFEPEFQVRRRVLSPLDEVVKAVPVRTFRRIARAMVRGEADPIDFRLLVSNAVDVDRREAEETEELVQLIPTFVVQRGPDILTYRRTKRLPEARLHYARCLNFGGHMQADDSPALFWSDDSVFDQFLFRELYEELKFDPPVVVIEPIGLVYLQGNAFERQHAGLAHLVRLTKEVEIESLEPGMHTDLQFMSEIELMAELDTFDSWSRVLMGALGGFAEQDTEFKP